MYSPHAGITKQAGGTIQPARFVRASANNTVVQASAGTAAIFGVSGRNAKRYDNAAHAESGDQCQVFIADGNEVVVEAGGTVAAGGYVTSDADGKAVAATIEDVDGTQTATSEFVMGPVIKGGADGELITISANLAIARQITP